MEKIEFEKLVVEALNDMPEEFQRNLENIIVVVEDEPPIELLDQMGLRGSGTLLGLYQGVPLNRRGRGYSNILPDKISIYKRPIESICYSEEEIKEKVRKVVMHEIGHYFGLSEQTLRKIGS